MSEVIFYAIPLGITLSFAAGPVFFVVVETSISKGKTKALILDLGAVLADIIFILIAFYGSQSLINSLRHNLWVASISGLAVAVFGGYYILKSRRSGQFQQKIEITKKRFLFVKGFLLNFLNIGVLFYWVATTMAIGSFVDHDPHQMLIFYVSVVLSYLFVDVFKIYFANKFKERLKGRTLQVIEKIIGFVLVLFGVFIILRNVI